LTLSSVQYEEKEGSTSVAEYMNNVGMSIRKLNGTTAIHEIALPTRVSLEQNFPNPFNPSTTISYSLPVSSKTTIKVYTLLGEEIVTLVNGMQGAGSHSISWNPASLPSGIYLYKLEAGQQVITKRMVLLK